MVEKQKMPEILFTFICNSDNTENRVDEFLSPFTSIHFLQSNKSNDTMFLRSVGSVVVRRVFYML